MLMFMRRTEMISLTYGTNEHPLTHGDLAVNVVGEFNNHLFLCIISSTTVVTIIKVLPGVRS